MKSFDDTRINSGSINSRNIYLKSEAIKSFYNYIVFCTLYSISHATVDAVLAFSSAELGPLLGSYGGFALYITYTLSALLFAKPFLRCVGAKYTILLGLCGLLTYVGSFFIALLLEGAATPTFITGAAIGGIGAGLIWTGQGSYYSLNSSDYHIKLSNDSELSVVLNNFAAIFAGTYLFLESSFKVLATLIFIFVHSSGPWKTWVFGIYTAASFLAVVGFYGLVQPLSSVDSDDDMGNFQSLSMNSTGKSVNETVDEIIELEETNTADILLKNSENPWVDIYNDVSAVTRALLNERKLQLLIPFQLSFGFSAGFIDYYVCGVIINNNIGDGYIGFISAITTITAVLLAPIYAKIANLFISGKWAIMIFAGFCFFMSGFPLLILSDKTIGTWQIIIPYFILHGAARGAWENTNKAVVAEYFISERLRDSAFASVYFTSGLSGALGYICYQYMDRWQLATLNTIVPLISIICYHYSTFYDNNDND